MHLIGQLGEAHFAEAAHTPIVTGFKACPVNLLCNQFGAVDNDSVLYGEVREGFSYDWQAMLVKCSRLDQSLFSP